MRFKRDVIFLLKIICATIIFLAYFTFICLFPIVLISPIPIIALVNILVLLFGIILEILELTEKRVFATISDISAIAGVIYFVIYVFIFLK